MSIVDEIFGEVPKDEQTKISLFKGDDVHVGVFDKATLLRDVRALKDKHPSNLQHMKRLFENAMLKRTLTRQPVVTHENGEAIIWCSFKYGNSNGNLRIANIDGMFDFIQAYALGHITVTTTFEDLLRSAAGEI
jgi:hypothetical protein